MNEQVRGSQGKQAPEVAPSSRFGLGAAARLGGLVSALLALGCSDAGSAADPRVCDEACQHDTAARAVREMLKLAYNLTLQANPVGPQDETTPCPAGGSARVSGEATSDARQGATLVRLDYDFSGCVYLQRDEEPHENYLMELSGTIHQEGTFAVQPNATTAVIMSGDDLSLRGSVYDPPLAYEQRGCALRFGQSGDRLSGRLCGKIVGADL
jgi:hypothetical protein